MMFWRHSQGKGELSKPFSIKEGVRCERDVGRSDV